jgi:nitrogen regulatory protein PII-like uncharacterized protein
MDFKEFKVEVDEDILGCAVRYALPRATYIVSVVAEEVIKNIDNLSNKCKSVIIRDIQEAFNEGRISNYTCDINAWNEVLDELKHSLNK